MWGNMCDFCYQQARSGPNPPLPPRLPDPSFIPNDRPARFDITAQIRPEAPKEQRARPAVHRIAILEAQMSRMARQKEDDAKAFKALNDLCTDLLAQLNVAEHAHIFANERGLFVVDVANRWQYTLQEFSDPAQVPAGYLGLCRFPYLQDESCKLPAGHLGEHGPAHLCNVDCGFYAFNAAFCHCGNTGTKAPPKDY